MGAFPSHDAPELIYTTLVTRPSTDTEVEVCLVPLLPRFFNDGHKKAKKRLNELLSYKDIHSRSAMRTVPQATVFPPASAAAMKGPEQPGTYALVDYLISSTEGFFFVNTRDAVVDRAAAPQAEQSHQAKAETSLPLAKQFVNISSFDDLLLSTGTPHASYHSPPQHTVFSSMRPVPFAIGIMEPESMLGNSTATGGAMHSPAGKHYQPLHNNSNSNNVVLIKGRRVQLLGFIACCMDRPVRHMNVSSTVRHFPASSGIYSAAADGKKPTTIPVTLDVIFDEPETNGYLIESAVLLASFAFRKQFLNSCALHFPPGDPNIEAAFDRHMNSLQLRLSLRHDNYRILRMFHSRYPLLGMVKDLCMHESSSAAVFSIYENDMGEYGLDVTFGCKFLARWMRYVEKMMYADIVCGNHIRCNTKNILQERDRLLQERRDSCAFLEEEEDDERLYGGSVYAVAMARWIAAEKRSLKSQQTQMTEASGTFIYPAAGAAQSAAGQYWPQMPVMMGQPSPWPAGVVPFSAAPSAGPMIAQHQQQLVIQAPGAQTQLYYAAPQHAMAGGTAFITSGVIPVVQQGAATAPLGMAAAPTASNQQIVYVMQGGQVPQGVPTSAATPAVPSIATGVAGPAFYYPQQGAYALRYPSYVLQQQQQGVPQQQQQRQRPMGSMAVTQPAPQAQ
ncbi:unnamed protein product [Trypanosoma congolense IL3000]|uniref:WGS project CAEQ00000000 data, annotated contig 2154 n=1 Tax=Trypanosoma congolense (strain IL3000) TaxID=1068625 RepID=F9WBW5_TRYCI|nr:unnamed protein product [Trypanosoma congolense IL3000]